MSASTTQPDARTRLLDAAVLVVRAQGYSATSVDDIRRRAELSKGAFFQRFSSKEDLALAAAAHFSQMAQRLFGAAPYRQHADSLDRLLSYVDFRRRRPTRRTRRSAMPATPTCTGTRPRSSRTSWRRKPSTRPGRPWSAEGLALYMQAVSQGAFVRAKGDGDVARAAWPIFRGYLAHLFHRPASKEER